MNDSREHILKVGFILFLQKSYKAVTMREIVEKSGLSKGAFYHYFSSKEDLFIEIIHTFYFRMMFIDFNQFNQNSFYEFYHQYIKHVIGLFWEIKKITIEVEDEGDISYFSLVFDAMKIIPGFNQTMIEHHSLELDAWSRAAQRARLTGEIKTHLTDEQIARMFVFTNDGVGMHLMIEGRILDLESEMISLWDSFYQLIKA